MSNNEWDDDDDDLDTEETAPDTGSDLIKKLRKAKRADEKRIQELTEKLDGFTKIHRERIVKEVLEQKGVNPKAQKFVLKDLEDVSEESVNAWLVENAEAIGFSVPEDESADEQSNLQALRQQDVLSQRGVTPDKVGDVGNKIDGAASYEELMSIINGTK